MTILLEGHHVPPSPRAIRLPGLRVVHEGPGYSTSYGEDPSYSVILILTLQRISAWLSLYQVSDHTPGVHMVTDLNLNSSSRSCNTCNDCCCDADSRCESSNSVFILTFSSRASFRACMQHRNSPSSVSIRSPRRRKLVFKSFNLLRHQGYDIKSWQSSILRF